MNAEEAQIQEARGNHVTEIPGKGFQRIVFLRPDRLPLWKLMQSAPC